MQRNETKWTESSLCQTAQRSALIDLHLHLDGSLSAEAAIKLADLSGVRLPTRDICELRSMMTCPRDIKSLDDCLACFSFPVSLMQTHEAMAYAVYDLVKRLHAQGLVYAEIRYAPQLHLFGSLTSQEEVVEASIEGLNNALKEFDIQAQLILCGMRGDDNWDANMETVEIAPKYLGHGVAAVDLAGAEALYSLDAYRLLFSRARSLGIPFTIHAGESGDPENVRLALDYGAKRIGHGIRFCLDKASRRLLHESDVTLEICPTSNLMTRALPEARSICDYPFPELIRDGVKFTINSDDMTVLGTTLADEFRLLYENDLLTVQQAVGLIDNAVQAAFLSETEKAALWAKCKARLGEAIR